MPPELEDRVRSALRSIPEPPDEVGARLRAAALGGFAPARRRRLGRIGRRALRALPAIGAVAAVGAILVALIVATPSNEPATPPATTGVELVVRAVPATQTDRLADVLRLRGEARGITGMTVTMDDGAVHVFVPRTHDVDWPVGALLSDLDTAIYDTASSTIAAGPDLGTVLDAVPEPVAGEPVHWYAVRLDREHPAQSFFAGPFADQAEARRAASPPGGRPRIVPVPRDVTIAYADDPLGSGNRGIAFAALRSPLVGRGDITEVAGDDGDLQFVVAEDARDRVDATLAGAATPSLVVVHGSGGTAQTLVGTRFERWDAASGSLVFRVPSSDFTRDPAAEVARMLAPGGVDASVEVVSSAPVGPPPARLGDVVPAGELPPSLRRMGQGDFADDPFRPRTPTVRRVITTETPGGRPVTLWSFRAENGSELVTGGGGTGGCPLAPDFPAVFPCMTGGSSAAGRVGEDVVRLTAEWADGRTREAAVANGFFLFLGLPSGRGPEVLVARDASGDVVARQVNGAPGTLPIGDVAEQGAAP